MATYQIIGLLGYFVVVSVLLFLIYKFISAQERMAKSLDEISRHLKSFTLRDQNKD